VQKIKFPNTLINKETTIEIDKITLQLRPSAGDLKENLMIWLPETKPYLKEILLRHFTVYRNSSIRIRNRS
jgi:hypothetical protein